MKKDQTNKTQINFDEINAWIVAILVLIPRTPIFEYFKFGVVAVLMVFSVLKRREQLKMKMITPMVYWLINSLLAAIMVLLVEQMLNTDVVLHEIERILYYSLLVILCDSISIRLKTLTNICRVLLLFNFIIQTMQFFKIGNTYNFLFDYYLEDKSVTAHLDMAYSGDFRSGSIFLNPNVYVVYPAIFLLVFLENTNGKFSIIDYVFIVISGISMFYTGSRTGLILFALVLLVYVYLNRKNKQLTWVVKIFLPAMMLIGYIILIRQNARVLDVEQGFSGSMGVKYGGFSAYIEQCSPWYYFFGSLGSDFRVPIDMEFGYIFEWWGLFGFLWYFRLIISLAKNNKEKHLFLSRTIQIVLIVSSFSCSIILNMSVFPFVCLVCFPHIIEESNTNDMNVNMKFDVKLEQN